GPKARAEYAAFMRQSRTDAAAAHPPPMDAAQEDLLATVTRESSGAPPSQRREASLPPHVASAHRDQPAHAAPRQAPTHGAAPSALPVDLLQTQAEALVQQFYQRFHGLTGVTPMAKELEHATTLLAHYGEAKASFLLAFARQAAPATDYTPRVFGGILHYLPHALAAYDAQAARATQAAAQRTAAHER